MPDSDLDFRAIFADEIDSELLQNLLIALDPKLLTSAAISDLIAECNRLDAFASVPIRLSDAFSRFIEGQIEDTPEDTADKSGNEADKPGRVI